MLHLSNVPLREDLRQELAIWMKISHFSILVSSAPFIYQRYSNKEKIPKSATKSVFLTYFVTIIVYVFP